ncbi:MAG TPA: hypothetical protein VNE00_21170 [Paraburkholderia sp.]|nr:hypothetical protein [Paraburkholderia sp.]
MNDPRTEGVQFSSREYVQRVTHFVEEVSGWCKDRELTVERGAVSLREQAVAPYEAASLKILKDGILLGSMVPVGSRVIGAEGRVDLIGRVARHALLYHLGNGPVFWRQTGTGGNAASSPSRRIRYGVHCDGWYWTEATILKPKHIDKDLFLDLLTDVSDYEFP